MATTYITFNGSDYVLENMRSGLYPKNYLLRVPGSFQKKTEDSFSLGKNKIDFKLEGYSQMLIMHMGVVIGSYKNVTLQTICNAVNYYFKISKSELNKIYNKNRGSNKSALEQEVETLSALKDELENQVVFNRSIEEIHSEIKIIYENI